MDKGVGTPRVGQPFVDQLTHDISDARHDLDTLDSEELIRRLDRLQQPAPLPELDYGRDL